jgi:hypothetical protein
VLTSLIPPGHAIGEFFRVLEYTAYRVELRDRYDACRGSITLSRSLTCNVMAGPGPSCSPFVLVDQPAEDPSPPYSRRRQVGGRGHGDVIAVWWPQVPGSVRAMVVVVRGVFIQDRAQVP